MNPERVIQPVVHKGKITDQKSDFKFWQSRPPLERMAALQSILREYNQWRYGDAEPRLQRVYTIIKRS
jgi:hypothetical protein